MNGMNSTESKRARVITMTNRAPVKIYEEEWPAIAYAAHKHWDGQHEFQAFRKWRGWIKVRRHADGRTLVYGCSEYDTAWQGESGYRYCGGLLLTAGADIPEAVHELAGQLMEQGAGDYMRQVAHECIADLPPETL